MLEPHHFRNISDWPKEGIQFKDIGPVLSNPQLLAATTEALLSDARQIGTEVDFVVAPEARGFLFGTQLALGLGAGLIPARKPGKLPPETHSIAYELEYGTDHLHVGTQDLNGAKVLIHDDLLATGGTAEALINLMDQLGADVIGASFVAELPLLEGRARLGERPVTAVVAL